MINIYIYIFLGLLRLFCQLKDPFLPNSPDCLYNKKLSFPRLVEITHNPNWSYISDHSYRILIIGGSGSEKTSLLLGLIKHQLSDIDKIYLCIKDPLESKYQLLNSVKWKIILFDNMIANMESNKKLYPIVTELFLRARKLNISLVFISQSYFKLPKTIRLKAIHFVKKISNKRELQQVASNHL